MWLLVSSLAIIGFMGFFSKLVTPSKKGEKNFRRARAAEVRGDRDKAREHFRIAAEAFDEHFATLERENKNGRASHLTMAGMSLTRIDRFEDALRRLDSALALRDNPDAFLYAGYAAAMLSDAESARRYWKGYPDWADRRIVANALAEQLRTLDKGGSLLLACKAVDEAIHNQDLKEKRTPKKHGNPSLQNRLY